MKAIQYIIIFVISIILQVGCVEKNQEVKWLRDTDSMHKIIPALSSCTNMIWYCEALTQNSRFSPPGPTDYRTCCFIPNASKTIHDLQRIDSETDIVVPNFVFVEHEKSMLKSEFNIDSNMEIGISGNKLNQELLNLPPGGKSIYFKSKDVLCIVLISF